MPGRRHSPFPPPADDLAGRRMMGPARRPLRYRGFVLIPQEDLTWLVRPERSPMAMLPFRAPASSVPDVKSLIDWRLDHGARTA